MPMLGVDPDAPPVEVKYDPSLDRKDNRDPVSLVSFTYVDGNGTMMPFVPRPVRHASKEMGDTERRASAISHREFMARERQRLIFQEQSERFIEE